MRILFTICVVFLTFVATPAVADIPPPTNNSTNAATNNGTADATNNATSDSTNNDTTSENNNSTSGDNNGTDSDTTGSTDDTDDADDKGCSVAGNPMGTFAPILIGLALLVGVRRRRDA